MTRPDGSQKVVSMKEEEPGRFAASIVETLQGIYTFRVRAAGTTFKERPFTREQTLTAVLGPTGSGDTTGGSDWCRILECLLSGKALLPDFAERLREHGVQWEALLDCLRRHCRTVGRKG